ncbi:MAG: glycosyltransferase [Paucibacter sp.]|nr:glycosyltransferase [Roseateles sp.]
MNGRPLRVLVAHNVYQHRGGEDSVMEAEVELLRRHGHAVEIYLRHNEEIEHMGRLQAARDALWSPRTVSDVAAICERFNPDLIHVHNTTPLISPSIFWAAERAGVPVVQTLHNFRLLCPQALLLREGRVCEDCVGKVPWRGVVHACYRGSHAQTAVLALGNTVHRWARTWSDKVTRFIALNDFARDKYIQGGLPAERIAVKPNFVDLPAPDFAAPREGLVFVGRLSEEKGVQTLIDAARLMPPGLRLRVVGDGPLADVLRAEPRIEWLGSAPPEQVYAQMRRASLLLLPSIWYENFPRTLVESFACGTPVLASDLGALPTLIEPGRTGLLAPAGNASAWAERMAWACAHADELAVMGGAARRHYEECWTAQANYEQLMVIYSSAVGGARGHPHQ